MKKKNIKITGLLFLITIFLNIFSIALAQEKETIKVGFPKISGFSDVSEEGELGGYLYEYLMEIAKYTGWAYDFVIVEGSNEGINEIYSKLESGEVDIVGATFMTEETKQLYDFPEYGCGMTYSTLSVLKSNEAINESNYSTFDDIRVGVYGKAKRAIQSLDSFCEANGIYVEKVPYNTEAELSTALLNKEVDALLGNDVTRSSGERIIARFAERPYYFAVTKGNTEIVSSMNMAISKINHENPHYATELYMKYFDHSEREVTLQKFIKANPTVSVIAAMSIGLVLALIVMLIVYIKNQRVRQIQLDIERYRVLSRISEELIFEYDIREDRLILSDHDFVFNDDRPVIDHFLHKYKNGYLDLEEDDKIKLQEAFKNKAVSENLDLEVQCEMSDGHKEWMRIISTIIYDKKKQPVRSIGKMMSIEKEKCEREMLRKKSQEDPLTGLCNRVYFEETVALYLKDRLEGEEGALMVIDLDCFKNVNDVLGHQIGDTVLSDLGKKMKENFRPDDILGRLGGDEFMVFMKNIQDNHEVLLKRAQELCKKMTKIYSNEDKSVEVSLSIGITVSRPGTYFDDLYKEADKALYYVKEHGKKSYMLYKNEQEER